MCLAVPGQIKSIREQAGQVMATVDFQGTRREVALGFVPDAEVGQWVLVHAGFAINKLDEAEALSTWDYLKALDTDLA